MNCTRCLRPVEPGARWCSFCGEPVQPLVGSTQPLPDAPYEEADQYAPVSALPAGGAAIAALILSIVGLVGPLPVLGSLLALAFAARARREAAYGLTGGAEIARAARILAWTGIVVAVVAATVIAGLLIWNNGQGRGYTFNFR